MQERGGCKRENEKEILSCGNTGNHEKDCCRWSDKKRMGWPCVHMRKPEDAAKFVAIRGHDEVEVIEVILPANKVKESFDHSVQFFQCKAFMYEEDIKVRPNAEVVEYSFK